MKVHALYFSARGTTRKVTEAIASAAAAFVGEHSFSTVLGSGRPDAEDLAEAASFGKAVAEAAANEDYGEGTVAVPGRAPYQFFKAVDDEGRPFDIRKAKPQTDPAFCNECGYCARICPMGAINEEKALSARGKVLR